MLTSSAGVSPNRHMITKLNANRMDTSSSSDDDDDDTISDKSSYFTNE